MSPLFQREISANASAILAKHNITLPNKSSTTDTAPRQEEAAPPQQEEEEEEEKDEDSENAETESSENEENQANNLLQLDDDPVDLVDFEDHPVKETADFNDNNLAAEEHDLLEHDFNDENNNSNATPNKETGEVGGNKLIKLADDQFEVDKVDFLGIAHDTTVSISRTYLNYCNCII